MKNLALILILAALSSICLMNCAEQNKVVGGKRSIVVPKGKTYVKLNAKGKEIARYSAGQVMAEDTVDCVVITCPPSFPANCVCWQCKARPEPATLGAGTSSSASHPGPPR